VINLLSSSADQSEMQNQIQLGQQNMNQVHSTYRTDMNQNSTQEETENGIIDGGSMGMD